VPSPHEHRRLRLVAGYSVLLLVIAGITTPVYLSVPDVSQHLVLRLAAGVPLGIFLVHIRSGLRSDFENGSPSEFERALHHERPLAKIDPLLPRLYEELRNSMASRRYFEQFLWRRLLRLVELRGSKEELKPPAPGWRSRRGPSLTAISELIGRIERNP
jgi:hypothetical protein